MIKRFFLLKKIIYLVILLFCIISFGCPPPPPPPKPLSVEIKVNLDNSASMGGYLNGNTEYKEILTGLASKLDNFSKKVDRSVADSTKRDNFIFLSSAKNTYLKSVNMKFSMDSVKFANSTVFVNTILSGQVMQGGSSPLHEIFDRMINESDTDKVNIFVSDLILSYSPEEIRKNPNINIDNLPSLQHLITLAFNKAREKNMVATIFEFDSKFSGSYFDCQNNIQQFTGIRPFYIIVFGKEDRLSLFLNEMQMLGFESPKMISLGFDVSKREYAILNYSKREGKWRREADRKGIHKVNPETGKSEKFVTGINFNGLPQEYQDKQFLLRSLIRNEDGLEVGDFKISTKDEFKPDDRERGVTQDLPHFTHFIEYEIKKITTDKPTLELSLKNNMPKWVKDYHTSDDRNIQFASSKVTFGLKNVIDGIADAYKSGDNLMNIKISIKK